MAFTSPGGVLASSLRRGLRRGALRLADTAAKNATASRRRFRAVGRQRRFMGLYSRQLYVMGHKAQRSLASSTVLPLGLSGLGAEVAKNLVLAGVAGLDVHDETGVARRPLASFLLREEDVGAPRAARAPERLAPLNPHVAVAAAAAGPFDAERLQKYACVVAVDRRSTSSSRSTRRVARRVPPARALGGALRLGLLRLWRRVRGRRRRRRAAAAGAARARRRRRGRHGHGARAAAWLAGRRRRALRGRRRDGGAVRAGRAFAVRVVDRHTLRITRGLGEHARGGRPYR